MRSLARLWPAMVHSVWHSPTVLEVLALRSVLDTQESVQFAKSARLFAWAEKSASCAFYLRQFLASLFRLDTAKNPLANQSPCGIGYSPCGKSRKRARSTPAATKSRRESRKNQPVLIRVTSGSVHSPPPSTPKPANAISAWVSWARLCV